MNILDNTFFSFKSKSISSSARILCWSASRFLQLPDRVREIEARWSDRRSDRDIEARRSVRWRSSFSLSVKTICEIENFKQFVWEGF